MKSWITFFSIFFFSSFALAGPATECCGPTQHLIFSVDYSQKKISVLERRRFKDAEFCKALEPTKFGNSYLVLTDTADKVALKMKVQIPKIAYSDKIVGRELSGFIQKIERSTFNLKIPECVDLKGKKIELLSLDQRDVLAKGSL